MFINAIINNSIGVLLAVLIVVMVVVMVLRVRAQNHPVPRNIRSTAKRVKNRMTRKSPDGEQAVVQNNYHYGLGAVGGQSLDQYRQSKGVCVNSLFFNYIVLTQISLYLRICNPICLLSIFDLRNKNLHTGDYLYTCDL